jgi:predicted DNA-binding transcriptional regulator AlpA
MNSAANNGENEMTHGVQVPSVNPEQRWLSYAKLAEKLGVCERTIRREVDDGKLPKPDKFRGCVRFDWLEVEPALKAGKRNQIYGKG